MVLLVLISLKGVSQDVQSHVDPPFPISKKEAQWLGKRGFHIQGYDWSNHEVNQYLLAALEQRKKVHKTWMIGAIVTGGSLVIGMVGVVAASAAVVVSQPVQDLFIGIAVTGFLGTLAGAVATPIIAITQGKKAKQFVSKAIQLLQDEANTNNGS